MLHIRLIKYLYLGLTVLALLCPIKISYMDFLPGLILMWFFYLFYHAGISYKPVNIQKYNDLIEINKPNNIPLFVALLYLIFYPIYIKFYTGHDVFSTIKNLFSGVSNYSLYQRHFSNEKLFHLSLNKLPLIVIHGFLRFMFIGIVFRNLIYKKRVPYINIISISIMTIVIIILGLSRGTSFEYFELFLIFFFAIVARRILNEKKKIISRKMMIRIGIISSVILIIFIYNIHIRMGDSFSFFKDPRFDSTSILFKIAKPLALGFFALYDYFLFGLHFTSTIASKLWLSSVEGFISLLIPHGLSLLHIDVGFREFAEKFIFIGSNWTPDTIILINAYGIIMAPVIVYFVGRFSRIFYSDLANNLSAAILLFYSCYFMFSLPIGNFITTSSANILTILLAVLFYKIKSLSKQFFNI